jgi:hypothetical protein
VHVTGAPKAAFGMRTYRQRWIQAELSLTTALCRQLIAALDDVPAR